LAGQDHQDPASQEPHPINLTSRLTQQFLSLCPIMTALIYNVTVKVAAKAHHDWVNWMRDIHIPEVMATACFSSYRFLHLEGYDDEEGFTYAIQYACPSRALFDIYQVEHAPLMQQKYKEIFDGQIVVFRTILKMIGEG
jgi:hypothetical protein